MERLPAEFASPRMRRRLHLLADSYRRATGMDLVEPAGDIALALWTAPRVIVAHGTEPDPVFFFGNRAALERFEATVGQFTAMPSRLSAEPPARGDRQALLERVARDGYVGDYAGIRVSLRGRRFLVRGAIVWNVADESGRLQGQAATFDRWEDL